MAQLLSTTVSGTLTVGTTDVFGASNSSSNTVATYANGTLVLANANLNFNNTSTVNVSIVANGTIQTNTAFTANITAIKGANVNSSGTVLASAAQNYVTPVFNIPPNTLRVGSKYRLEAIVTNTATAETCNIAVKFGTAGTTADANLISCTLGAGTAAVGNAFIKVEVTVRTLSPTAGVIATSVLVFQTGTTGFTNQAVQVFNSLYTTANTTTGSNYLGLCLVPSSASVVNVQAASIETIY